MPDFLTLVDQINAFVYTILAIMLICAVTGGVLLGNRKIKEIEATTKAMWLIKEAAKLERERVRVYKAKLAEERAYLRDLKARVVEKR